MSEWTPRDVSAEIERQIEKHMADGAVLDPVWLTQAIMAQHGEVDGADASFHLCCAREHVRAEVRRRFNRFKLTPETHSDPQLVLPGFDKLQRYYATERDGEARIVPIEMLSVAEIEAKAGELEAMGRGCFAHADELRQYRSMRASNEAA
jgi:hypothetical protein